MLGSSGVTPKQLCYFVPMSAAGVSEVQHRQIKIKSAAASTVWPLSANLGCTCMGATLACSAVVSFVLIGSKLLLVASTGVLLVLDNT